MQEGSCIKLGGWMNANRGMYIRDFMYYGEGYNWYYLYEEVGWNTR